MRQSTSRAFLMAACMVWLAAAGPVAGQSPSRPPDASGALHARALLHGGTLSEAIESEDMPSATVGELARRAAVVLIGQTVAHRSRLSADRERVTTDFVVKIQEVVKGPAHAGKAIVVRLPGGGHLFTDGARVHQFTRGYEPLRDGARYVLFLNGGLPGTLGSRPVFETAAGMQGFFELDFEAGRVVPASGDRQHPLNRRYRDMALVTFLAELHRSVPRGE